MSATTRRLGAGCLLLVLACGCGPKTKPAPIVVESPAPESAGPNEIELYEPKATLVEPMLVQFEVKYRFTKGRPNRVYSCEIFFPGTLNHGVKSMDSWQLQTEGVIKDGVNLRETPVKEFEIHISEAVTPQDGFKKISNVVRGEVK